ncbi:kinetochore protein Spc25 [Thalassophryne amazonica]|uniref:kinetochore protein Spc25 n=1 Tax=Thalassophryne amazonica TaxID=390379 RepID=UPI001470CD48|nr:kinetochore protein Spc25 [Thalassophryne amazonica]
MMSVTDPNMGNRFASDMEESHTKHLKTYGEIFDTTAELCQAHKQFVKSALDTCLKKCKDDEMLFETIQVYKKDLELKNTSFKEKRHTISEVISEIQQKDLQKGDIIQKIEKLRDEQAKRKELIEVKHKANKGRLKNLQKARLIFQDHLGLEIRTIRDKSQLHQGEKLQFVFRNINPADEDCAYVVMMGIKEDRSYQIMSSDPELECLQELEKHLMETNNLAAFLVNVRKEFISQVRC